MLEDFSSFETSSGRIRSILNEPSATASLFRPFDPVVQLKSSQVDLHRLLGRIGHFRQLLHGQAGIGPYEIPNPIRRRGRVVGHVTQELATGEKMAIPGPDLGGDETIALQDAEMV